MVSGKCPVGKTYHQGVEKTVIRSVALTGKHSEIESNTHQILRALPSSLTVGLDRRHFHEPLPEKIDIVIAVDTLGYPSPTRKK